MRQFSMGDGSTPLMASVRIAPESLYFKLENCNPSGSYKDRFVTGEVQRIVDAGGRACLATSSGNTGSALAACCARAGVRCIILVNKDAPEGKLVQMQAHGAVVVRIPGFGSAPSVSAGVFRLLDELRAETGTAVVVSAYCYCPVGMSGVQKISLELLDQLPDIEHVFVPVGGGGLYSAVVRGFGTAAKAPRVHAVQPDGCPTVLNAVRSGSDHVDPVQSTTRVSGLSVPFDLDASLALRLLRENGGHAIGVSDEEVFQAHQCLLREEGIYAEPAGAAALAGYRNALTAGLVAPDARSVCLVTGHGFKDPGSAQRVAAATVSPAVEPESLRTELMRLLSEL